MSFERCFICDDVTGNSGMGEGSLFVDFDVEILGPYCDECYGKVDICGCCGLGFIGNDTDKAIHASCILASREG